jgi:hypothetical protein
MAQSGYPANPLKKIRFSKCVNLIAVLRRERYRTLVTDGVPMAGGDCGIMAQRHR